MLRNLMLRNLMLRNLKLRNERGNVLLIFLLSTAISTLAVFSFYYTRNTTFIANSVLQTTGNNIQRVQANLVSTLNNPLAWYETYRAFANGDLNRCMTDSTYSCPRRTNPLLIMNGMGAAFYNATNANVGFTNTGAFCATFGMASNQGCQLRFNVTWTPECPPNGACPMPSIVVNMDLVTVGYSGVYSINPTPYRYVLRIQ